MSARRVALVTGSSRGIGRAIAVALAADHDLVIQYRARQEDALALEAILLEAGAEVLVCQADIADAASLEAMIARCRERFGRLDSLVANAATGLNRPISVSRRSHVSDSLDIIAGSFVDLVTLAAPLMTAGGRIVAISGIDSRFAVSDHGLIGAGKAALESLVRNLAVELGPRGITVNAVVPGPVRTESLVRALERKPGAEQPLIDSIPAGRLAEPADIAAVVAFLCSAGAAYVNGASLLVDGGLSAGIGWTQQQRLSLERGTWPSARLGT
jgi:NAD(P)-dependent dehydrogenase (short-subunit alcohol dehydrogenase family)